MTTEPLLMHLENNVYLEGEDALIIIDRRKLPRSEAEVYCTDHVEVARAIEQMMVQGAGDIAITAGYGLYLAAREMERQQGDRNMAFLKHAADRLCATRPTGYHLAVLMGKLLERVRQHPDGRASEIILAALKKSLARQREISQATGRQAETILETGDTVLTHCFAGAGLLYMFRYARENGKEIKALCTETRPYLQGARLTAWSLSEMGIETTLITDNMAAWCMSRGMIDKVFTAADRIALDGAAANKVGTLQLAICARHFGIPFYILGYGGPDRRTLRGSDIPIEERDPREVLEFQGTPITGERVRAYYPAFDVTPPELITAIVTREGIYREADNTTGGAREISPR
ncbi:MAG TPA: s-methyl-5-thioribose-1-phosphate isomerase [Syntrophales bacterium]|jgi:methylthioribose-1-phosphate isomerase|nr:s-methyl-5-thioribose-1-phosphate isomerase [Syntrophales bacterium]HON23447.1 s-methyl-5-thioribose-1-phosphate isomerase [Syntrophales bacterium]HOU78528.1 s-methyl-5-thioribose-1-phosphate isomerase [Syntrophales bacterium]HPC33253.1 s-methyl-5-thioribose-1-phosphate isomerase [Syntrophales bacterium]HQG34661.1 s-methyl-5-thioribose-1-phosphate isomerase [Syntrophales bacterium]